MSRSKQASLRYNCNSMSHDGLGENDESETRVELEGRIVDLRTGQELWAGKAFASSAEQSQQSQGGLVGLLVTAIVKQIVGAATDASYNFAGTAQARLLGAPRYNGILPGPRSPQYGQPVPTQ